LTSGAISVILLELLVDHKKEARMAQLVVEVIDTYGFTQSEKKTFEADKDRLKPLLIEWLKEQKTRTKNFGSVKALSGNQSIVHECARQVEMDIVTIPVPLSEIKRVAHLIKGGKIPQAYLNIALDGTIDAHWYSGRSDFVLSPGFIVLLLLDDYSEEAITFAIRMVIRNQDGYHVDPRI
jgi:hypothetical protein